MHKIPVVLIIVLFFSGASVRAEKFTPIGSMNFCGLSQFSERATGMLEKIDPALKCYPVMLSLAVAMNPQFSSFDLSAPATVNYYLSQQNPSLKPVWCASVRRSSGRLLDEFEMLKQKLHTKYFDDRVLISNSRELLTSITSPPASPQALGHEVEMTFQMTDYNVGTAAEIDQMIVWLDKNVFRKTAGNGGGDETVYHDSIRRLLAQTATVEIKLDIRPDYLDLNLELIPVKGSAFESFLRCQSINTRLLPAPVKGKSLSLSFNVADFPPVRSAAAVALADMKTVCSDGERVDYCRLMEVILNGCDGSGVFYIEENGRSAPQTCARFMCANPEAATKIRRETAAIKSFKPLTSDMFLIYSQVSLEDENSSNNLYCAIRRDSVFMASGSFDDKEADRIMDGIGTALPSSSRKGMLFAEINVDGKPGATAEIGSGGTLKLNVRMLTPMLKRIIPAPPKGKNNRVQMTF